MNTKEREYEYLSSYIYGEAYEYVYKGFYETE